MNISKIMRGVVKDVQSNLKNERIPQQESVTPSKPITSSVFGFFSKEAQDERYLKRMRKFEKKNKERSRKEAHDKEILTKWGFNK